MTDVDPQLQLFLLGEIRLELDDDELPSLRTRKTEALLIYLACTGRSHTRERLATLFWDESGEKQGMANLRASLSSLRKHLRPMLNVDRKSLAVADQGIWVDTLAFERAVTDVIRTITGSQREGIDEDAVRRLRAALDLYRGDFLEGFHVRESIAFDEWAMVERERLRQLAERGLALLVEQLQRLGRYDAALPYARRRAQLDPFNEGARRDLMLLLARTGQHNAALEQYEQCRRELDQELGVAPAAETAALAARIGMARRMQPPPLPQPSQRLIGRRAEVAVVRSMLRDPYCRLLTIVGAGGIGKTRLALAVARRLAEREPGRFLHGIYFIPLAAVTTSAQLAPALADGMRLPAGPKPRSELLDFVREKELLLVLDNFEQLIDRHTIDLLRDMLDAAPRLTLLITSQQRLNLRQERLLPLEGLSSESEADDEADAVALFLASARRMAPRFEPSAVEREHIVAICRRLAGMPLGIELSAAWVEQIPLSQIDRQLAANLDFATVDWPDVATRHRSLRDVFARSWELLSPEEQGVLRRLATFRGAFAAAAAAAIAGATLTQLRSLARRSVLEQPDTGRYALHAVVRHYAAEKLDADGAIAVTTRDAHAEYFLSFAGNLAPVLVGDRAPAAAQELEQVLPDVRAAWRHGIDGGQWARVDQAVDGLFNYYLYRSRRVTEGRDLFRHALDAARRDPAAALLAERLRIRLADLNLALGAYDEAAAALHPIPGDDVPPADRGLGLTALSRLHFFQGEFGPAVTYAERSLAAYRESDDLRGQAFALNLVALMVAEQGDDLDRADQLYEESLRIMRRLGDKNGVARALINLGGNYYVRREIDKAQALFAQSSELYRATGYRHGLATALRNLGLIATEAEEYDSALEAARESLALTREAGDRMGIVMSLKRLADISRARGEARNARDYYVEAAQLADEIHADGLLVTVLPAYARLLLQNDRTEAAVRLLSYLEEPVADNRELREMVSQDLAKARERLAASELDRLMADGRALDQHGALRLALTAW